jgi:predicted metal-binding membrane protein
MIDAALAAVLRRDRVFVATALLLVVALAWAYLLWLADDMAMGGMEMPEFRMIPSGGGLMVPMASAWHGVEFVFVFIMWAVMMVGMMTPSAAPMILIYARVARQAADGRQPFAPATWFAGGYLIAWFGFSLAATLAQWAVERRGWLTPAMAAASGVFGGVVMIAAGLYQWTSLKDACLRQCQSPFQFIQRHGGFRPQPMAALVLGLRHGAYCIGCCWMLMALLFVGGVMNVLWIALIMIVVLLEKLIPVGRVVARVSGAAFLAAGVWLVAEAL